MPGGGGGAFFLNAADEPGGGGGGAFLSAPVEAEVFSPEAVEALVVDRDRAVELEFCLTFAIIFPKPRVSPGSKKVSIRTSRCNALCNVQRLYALPRICPLLLVVTLNFATRPFVRVFGL